MRSARAAADCAGLRSGDERPVRALRPTRLVQHVRFGRVHLSVCMRACLCVCVCLRVRSCELRPKFAERTLRPTTFASIGCNVLGAQLITTIS